ncbi:MAG: DUF3499 domain-containing protein [Acidimicrobiia bacterium]|nr:DUF3499 domain-containing protein [Acidimicrobiia bacterium]
MARSCARPTCAEPAATTLSYDYAASTVWVDHLEVDDHPMNHDLCLGHADRLVVPQGWLLEDRRATLRRIA